MILHTDHIIPGMRLEEDIELKTGRDHITRKDLNEGYLTERTVESIRKFSPQIIPCPSRIQVADDEIILQNIRKHLLSDLQRVVEAVVSGEEYNNFLLDGEIKDKVLRGMEILFANPNIIMGMYNLEFNSGPDSKPVTVILEHSIRTALLALALGIRLRCSILSLVSIGSAALMHDMGIVKSWPYPDLEALDDCSPQQIEQFVKDHQDSSHPVLPDLG